MTHPSLLRILQFVFAALAVFICARIEWLNYIAGWPLPNREYRNNDPREGTVKWREFLTDRAMIARMKGLSEPLTAEQEAAVEKTQRRFIANNTLRTFVGTVGLLQYLVVPCLTYFSIAQLISRRRAGRSFNIRGLRKLYALPSVFY